MLSLKFKIILQKNELTNAHLVRMFSTGATDADILDAAALSTKQEAPKCKILLNFWTPNFGSFMFVGRIYLQAKHWWLQSTANMCYNPEKTSKWGGSSTFNGRLFNKVHCCPWSLLWGTYYCCICSFWIVPFTARIVSYSCNKFKEANCATGCHVHTAIIKCMNWWYNCWQLGTIWQALWYYNENMWKHEVVVNKKHTSSVIYCGKTTGQCSYWAPGTTSVYK